MLMFNLTFTQGKARLGLFLPVCSAWWASITIFCVHSEHDYHSIYIQCNFSLITILRCGPALPWSSLPPTRPTWQPSLSLINLRQVSSQQSSFLGGVHDYHHHHHHHHRSHLKIFTTRLDGDQRPTVAKPDGELHVRDGQGLLRRHVLPQTGCDHHHVDEGLLGDGIYPSSIATKIMTTPRWSSPTCTAQWKAPITIARRRQFRFGDFFVIPYLIDITTFKETP